MSVLSVCRSPLTDDSGMSVLLNIFDQGIVFPCEVQACSALIKKNLNNNETMSGASKPLHRRGGFVSDDVMALFSFAT